MYRGLPTVGPPRLQTGDDLGRHATWLELFFDLVFVVAIAELAHDLTGNVTPTRLVGFVGLFVPVFLVWMNYSYYADLFGEEGLDRYAMFAAMFCVAALSTTLHDALAGSLAAFTVGYLALRLLLIALYYRAGRANPSARAFVTRYVQFFSVSALFWAASLLVAGPLTYALVAVGLVIEVVTPAVTYYTVAERPTQVSHMPERFGLFTIIVLGEVIVSVVSGLADTQWSLVAVAAAVGAFVVAALVWWLYFAHVREETISEILRSNDFVFVAGMGYTYGHFGVTLGIAAAGTGMLLAIVAAAEGAALAFDERLLIAGGVTVFLFGTAVTHGAVGALSRTEQGIRTGTAAIVLLFGTVSASSLALVALLVVLLGAVALSEWLPGRRGGRPEPTE